MKVKVSEASGAALDWAVTKCEGRSEPEVVNNFKIAWYTWGNTHYSTNWLVGGPIIEREEISLSTGYEWEAVKDIDVRGRTDVVLAHGETPLIAAMRCYVASKLGDEVEVPDEIGEGK